jgi:glycosyltransferase involved in cell wall biosynthesis
MHMIFISPSYYPHIGGVEYVVKSISERLVEMGHKIAVLAGELGVNSLHEEIVNGVRVVRWPVWSPGEAYYYLRRRDDLRRLLRD